jgi:hypothetical protein
MGIMTFHAAVMLNIAAITLIGFDVAKINI